MLGRLLEKRGSFQALWGSGVAFERTTATGMAVNQDTSLKLSAVYACVRLIADTISTLPVDQFIRRDGQRFPYRPRDMWVDSPNALHSRTQFWQQVVVSLLLDGNAFVQIVRDEDGGILSLDVLNPTRVEPTMSGNRLVYAYRGSDRQFVVERADMLHITELLLPGTLRGVSRIAQARDSLGLGMALEEYAARFFGNGAYAGGVLEVPGELTQEQAKDIVDSWEAGHRGLRKAHRPAVLYGGAKFSPTTVDPSESQLLEERKFAVEEVARIFRVPPFMLGVSTPGAVSYASVEQQMLFFEVHTIQPYVQVLENAFSSLLTNGTFIKFNLASLARADLATRTESYSKALLAGYMSVNDVRRLEDMRDVTSGDQYRVPLQNLPLTDAGVATLERQARVVQQLVVSGFTPESAAQVAGLAGLESTGLPSVQLQAPSEAG